MLLLPANFPEPYPALKRLLRKVFTSPLPASSSTATAADPHVAALTNAVIANGGTVPYPLPLTIRFVVERTVLEPTGVEARPWQSVTQRSPLQTRIVWTGWLPSPASATASA